MVVVVLGIMSHYCMCLIEREANWLSNDSWYNVVFFVADGDYEVAILF